MVREKGGEGDLDEDDVLFLVLRTFKWEFIAAIGNFIVDSLFRITFSVVIFYLFEAVEKG